ncbi:glycoside hydrolase family 16 protein [Shewanella sp. SNU WT4]|uniref:glycoside hydrolase family 16 protein n=1 Tax=Shewanella sp. SNU WT4 TaxID=2590015 RepID=UPI00143DEC89|nr:glycoside hydrolase family 16 protein [Shewanella sp. SNU WT4]
MWLIHIGLSSVLSLSVQAQTVPEIGELLFEENFNHLDTTLWQVSEGNGCHQGQDLCGWGNQELQYYRQDNVGIEDIANEPGNRALVLKAERGPSGKLPAFYSGKVDSKQGLHLQFGMVEIRMQSPAVKDGLWPAAWMLGANNKSWPKNGEIDIMEMGQHQQAKTMAQHPNADSNHYVGSNVIFHADAACASDNPTCAAMTAWQNDNAYVAKHSLAERFVVYRLYWGASHIRFTIVDDGQEHDMYASPIAIPADASELLEPFYLIFNLAVGGTFTEAQTAQQVSAPLPAKLLIDYVRVYQLNDAGKVTRLP